MRFAGRWCAQSLAMLVAGCAATANPRLEVAPDPARTMHVVRHGGHSGIVLKLADLPLDAWPMLREFAGAEHIEIGWGDRDYYPAPSPTAWMALRAVLLPKPGVLHVVGFRGTPREYFPASEVVTLGLGEPGLARLQARLRESFEFDSAGNAVFVAPGLYGDSRFYASRESFHLLKTCNVWTAGLLREAGLPVVPAAALSAESLLRQLRPLGTSQDSGIAPDGAMPGYKRRSPAPGAATPEHDR